MQCLFPEETAALREKRCFLQLQRIQCGAGGEDVCFAGLPDLKLGKAWQTHGHALPPEGHATIQHLLAGKVERPGTGLGGKGGDVGGRYACAHQYLHFLPGSFHQLPQQGSTLRVTTDNLSARLHGTRQALETRWQWVNALASTAGGTLSSKQKIKLEAYIQMNYLDRILRYANTRLMQMTAGQYELERIGAENQRSQSGLDLGVIDHYNGTRRSVKTLSGGESFKASLALALGLSDEVQSSAGGIRLDTLFLDEGFGSLDEESLELAIRVLSGLTEGDRLVGIISHVGALKDRIDRQVVVHKARTGGSTVELRV